MTIKDILKKYHKIEIELLLAHVLRKPKEFFYMSPEFRLTRIQTNKLTRMVQRRGKGEPIAYILGYKDFYGLRFKVNKNVLIPRPETEGLVDLVLAKLRLARHSFSDGGNSPPKIGGVAAIRQTGRYDTADSTTSPRFQLRQGFVGQVAGYSSYSRRRGSAVSPVKILDIGTGSGCIAVSIAKQLRIKDCELRIKASDVSSEALKAAKRNAKAHKVKIKFIKSDLLKNVKGNFDIIIANLPYVPESDYKSIAENLKFEPKSAIFQKENGLYLIRSLLEQIALMKFLPKFIYLEFDPRQKIELAKLIKKSLPGSKTKFYKNYNNFWRCVEITNHN